MRVRRAKFWWLLGLSGCLIFACAAFVGLRILRHSPPPGVMKDIRAGLAARHIADPDARLLTYMEERYGSMSDPAHRQEAFLDFFNVEHIRTLQLLVKHSPQARRQENIDAMARWIAAYRASLTSEERSALNARFQSGANDSLLKRATAQYNSQDVRYRGSTAPVISELLRTLREIEASQ